MDVETAPLLVKNYRNYRLHPFLPLLTPVLQHVGGMAGLQKKSVLELGPGRRIDLLRFLNEACDVAVAQGAGRAVIWPWTRDRAFIRQHVVQVRLLDFFKTQRQRYDIIVSRYVFEQHSIDSWILLRSAAYWRQFKKRDFRDFDAAYPASIPNLQAIYKQAWKRLKPGGIMVSHLCKRKYSALNESFLKSLRPQSYHIEAQGSLSAVVTVTKS